MQDKQPTFGVKFLLFLFFFLGIALTVLVIVDAEYTHVLAKPPSDRSSGNGAENDTTEPVKKVIVSGTLSQKVEQARKSVVLVISMDCTSKKPAGSGTGFVVKKDGETRYIATNEHVIRDSVNCNGFITLDYKGRKHKTQMVGISLNSGMQNDMAILKIENIKDDDLPALPLVNSSEFQSGHDGKIVVTVGYPVVGTASTINKASVSSDGTISQFDTSKNCFIAAGLSLNPGNSGGPVFLKETFQVLGIAVAKAKLDVAENIGMFIPINRFKNLFREKTGMEL